MLQKMRTLDEVVSDLKTGAKHLSNEEYTAFFEEEYDVENVDWLEEKEFGPDGELRWVTYTTIFKCKNCYVAIEAAPEPNKYVRAYLCKRIPVTNYEWREVETKIVKAQ